MSRIVRNGVDWLNPAAPATAWQRERERGVIQPMDAPRGESWLSSLVAALCVAAFVAVWFVL